MSYEYEMYLLMGIILTKIVENLPELLKDGLSQKGDLELLRLFVKTYNEGGSKAVKQQIKTVISNILEEE